MKRHANPTNQPKQHKQTPHHQPKQPTPIRTYIKQIKRLSEEIGINKKMLEETFKEEMKSNP
jgi:hypothetical protein